MLQKLQSLKKFVFKHKYKIITGISLIAAGYYIYEAMKDQSNIKLSAFFQALRNNQLDQVVVGKNQVFFKSELSQWYHASIIDFPKQQLFKILQQTKDVSFRCAEQINQQLRKQIVALILVSVPTYIFVKYLNSQNQLTKFQKKPKNLQTKQAFKQFYGGQQIKTKLRQIIDFVKNEQKFIKMGARVRKGVLLYGPPGTGKTMLARSLAYEAGMGFISVCASQFEQIYVGVGPKRIRQLFALARGYPGGCIIFIDELDAIGSRKQGLVPTRQTSLTINQLLTEMDGYQINKKIIVVGATNRIDLIDAAILRSGRFDLKFKINLPDAVQRQGILRKIIQRCKVPHQIQDHQIRSLTQKLMQGWSGADIQCAVNQSIYLAIAKNKTKISSQQLLQATKSILIKK